MLSKKLLRVFVRRVNLKLIGNWLSIEESNGAKFSINLDKIVVISKNSNNFYGPNARKPKADFMKEDGKFISTKENYEDVIALLSKEGK